MSDIVLEQCSKYYPTNPIFIFQHNVRHCIERSYMYVRNSQKNVSQSNPIFNFHHNVKPVVDESPPIWQHRVPIEGWVFYRRRLVVHTQTVVSCVLFQEFSTGTASPFWLDACGSVQLTWAHVISSFIQTIIQPFPNARRQLPSCIPSRPIVDQLYDDVPTLKSTSACLNSLRVVSPGNRRWHTTRKGPLDPDRRSCPYKTPPRAVADSVSIQWSSEVRP